MGDDGFENEVGLSFPAYRILNIACLAFMPVPTVPSKARARNGMPYRVLSGKGPFDVYGYTCHDARFVGAEIKMSRKRRTSLPIIGPHQHGSGLQYHQLDALANLAENNGVARIVWSNCGEVGILHSRHINNALKTYEHAMKSLASHKTPPSGSRSILWDLFEPVDMTIQDGQAYLDWLKLDL
jgi:hypothetical protein